MCVNCSFSDPICTTNMVKSLHVILLTASSSGDRNALPDLSHSANQCIFPCPSLRNKIIDMSVWTLQLIAHVRSKVILKPARFLFGSSALSLHGFKLINVNGRSASDLGFIVTSISTLSDTTPSLCVEIVRKYMIGSAYYLQTHRFSIYVFCIHICYRQWSWKNGMLFLKQQQTLWKQNMFTVTSWKGLNINASQGHQFIYLSC